MGGGLVNPVLLLHLLIKAQHAFVKFARAVKKQANITRQHAMQRTVIDHADILEIEAIACDGIFCGDLSGKHGALDHQPRHDRRKPQRDPRHFAGIKRFQIFFDAFLIVFAEEMKIFMCFGKQFHRFVKYARHKYHVTGIAAYLQSLYHLFCKTPHYLHYTAVFLDYLLMFCEYLAKKVNNA